MTKLNDYEIRTIKTGKYQDNNVLVRAVEARDFILANEDHDLEGFMDLTKSRYPHIMFHPEHLKRSYLRGKFLIKEGV